MLRRIRSLHPLSLAFAFGTVLLFIWLNLDFTRDAYKEPIPSGWMGGMRCGFPLICWDNGHASTAKVVHGHLKFGMVPYGGMNWLGLFYNLLVFGFGLLGVVWTSESALRILRAKQAPITLAPRRMHAVSYAVGLGLIALLLAVNAQHEIKNISRPDFENYQQTLGWPLNIYSASRPAPIEYQRAQAQSADMLSYLQANPDAFYRIARWNTQNLTWNLLIGVTLVSLSLYLSELVLQFRRPALQVVESRAEDRQRRN